MKNLLILLFICFSINGYTQIEYIGKTQEETIKFIKSCCPEAIVMNSNDDTLLVNRDGVLTLFLYEQDKVKEVLEMFDLSAKDNVLKILRERYSESVFGFFYKEFRGNFYMIDYVESPEDGTFTTRAYKEEERIKVVETKN